MFRNFLLAFSFFLMSVGDSAAAMVVFNFSGETGGQASTAGTTTPNATSTSVSRGTGLTISTTANSINSSAFTSNLSVDLTDFYGFTFTPDPGFKATATTLTFAERRSSTGIREFEVRSSFDGFNTFTSQSVIAVPDDDLVRNQVISLTGLTNFTSTLGIRIYGYASEAQTGTWRLSNGTDGGLVLNGQVTAVPEPTSIVFGGILSAAGWVALRRRRKVKRATQSEATII